MEAASGPYVLDSGVDAQQHCKASGTISVNGITLGYDVFELGGRQDIQVGAGTDVASTSSPTDKVIMIMGFAAAGRAWLPTLKDLFLRGDKATGIEVVVFDNRGIGRSSCPTSKAAYSTDLMAQDAIDLMDHLGWAKAHVVGHSMGAMISSRLALMAPERVASLTLISVTGGNSEAIPLNCTVFRTLLRSLGRKDHHTRASVDLAFHFTRKLLHSKDPASGRRVKDILMEEYVGERKEFGPQPQHGQDGHGNAVMQHGVSAKELRTLAAAGFPIKVIHGCDDIVALPRHAARMARALGAPLVMLDGAHFVTRDCARECNDELLATIEAVRHGATHVDAVHICPDPQMYERGVLMSCFCCA